MCCNNLRKYWGGFLPFLGHMPRFIPSISLIWWADIHKAFIYPNEMKIECWKLAMYIWDEMSTADVPLQPNDCFKIGLCFHLWFERKSALWNCWINIAAIIHTHTHTMSNCNPGTNEGKRNDICLVYITSMTPFLFELYRNYGKRMDMCTECNAFKHTHTLLLSFYTLP